MHLLVSDLSISCILCFQEMLIINIKSNLLSFSSSWGSFVFLLLVFQKFLEPKRCFTLKGDSDDRDCFLQSHVFTVIKTELSDGRVLQNSYRYHHMIIHFHTHRSLRRSFMDEPHINICIWLEGTVNINIVFGFVVDMHVLLCER